MGQLLRAASFIVFLVVGLRLQRLRGEDARRRVINRLLTYVLALQAVAGLAQWDDWPFTSHIIAVGRPKLDTPICMTEFSGVGAFGREWRVDPYSWLQVYDSILQYWFEQAFARLPREDQDRALQFLLERAETGRRRLARGDPLGYKRLLGPLASPYWLLLPRAKDVSTEPYTGIRVYRACWTPRERAEDRSRGTRTLMAEYPR